MDPQQPVEHTFENPITPHRKINWLFVILAIIGFFAVLTTGYFLGSNSSKTKAEEIAVELSPTEYVIPTESIIPTEYVRVNPTTALQPTQELTSPTKLNPTIDLSNTTVYKNEEYKISFNIRKDERVLVCPSQGEGNEYIYIHITTAPPKKDTFSNQGDCLTILDYPLVASKKALAEVYQSVENYLKSLKDDKTYINTAEPISIAGVPALEIRSVWNPFGDGGGQGDYERMDDKIILSHNGIFYILDATYLNRNLRFL